MPMKNQLFSILVSNNSEWLKTSTKQNQPIDLEVDTILKAIFIIFYHVRIDIDIS